MNIDNAAKRAVIEQEYRYNKYLKLRKEFKNDKV